MMSNRTECDKYTTCFTELIKQLNKTKNSFAKLDKSLVDLNEELQGFVDCQNASTKELKNIAANSKFIKKWPDGKPIINPSWHK